MSDVIVEAELAQEIWWESQVVNVPPWTYEDYPTVHNAAVGYAGGLGYPTIGQDHTDDPTYGDYFLISRFGLVFDVTPHSGKTATNAVIGLYGLSDGSDTDFDVVLVSGADLVDTFVGADYGDLLNDITSLGSFSTADFAVEGWNNITLNATGLAALQAALDDEVKFRIAIRSSRDISSITPDLNGGDHWEDVQIYDHQTANKKPKLTITVPSTRSYSYIIG